MALSRLTKGFGCDSGDVLLQPEERLSASSTPAVRTLSIHLLSSRVFVKRTTLYNAEQRPSSLLYKNKNWEAVHPKRCPVYPALTRVNCEDKVRNAEVGEQIHCRN